MKTVLFLLLIISTSSFGQDGKSMVFQKAYLKLQTIKNDDKNGIFNSEGKLVEYKNPLSGKSYKYSYDKKGRVIKIKSDLGHDYFFEYYPNSDEVIAVLDSDKNIFINMHQARKDKIASEFNGCEFSNDRTEINCNGKVYVLTSRTLDDLNRNIKKEIEKDSKEYNKTINDTSTVTQ